MTKVLSRPGSAEKFEPVRPAPAPLDLCKMCRHERRDHYADKEKTHAHFRDSMQMKGIRVPGRHV
jgi:hypothetical protein